MLYVVSLKEILCKLKKVPFADIAAVEQESNKNLLQCVGSGLFQIVSWVGV